MADSNWTDETITDWEIINDTLGTGGPDTVQTLGSAYFDSETLVVGNE